jgi:hypothetical protein
MDEINLDVKEQFIVLILSTIAGFAASKVTENGITKLIKQKKATS